MVCCWPVLVRACLSCSILSTSEYDGTTKVMKLTTCDSASPVDGGYGSAGYGSAGGYGGYPAMGWGSPYAGYAAGPAPAPQQQQQQSLASLMNPLFGGNGGSYSPLISSLLGR